jgi:hypothetical protein
VGKEQNPLEQKQAKQAIRQTAPCSCNGLCGCAGRLGPEHAEDLLDAPAAAGLGARVACRAGWGVGGSGFRVIGGRDRRLARRARRGLARRPRALPPPPLRGAAPMANASRQPAHTAQWIVGACMKPMVAADAAHTRHWLPPLAGRRVGAVTGSAAGADAEAAGGHPATLSGCPAAVAGAGGAGCTRGAGASDGRTSRGAAAPPPAMPAERRASATQGSAAAANRVGDASGCAGSGGAA